MPKVQNLLRVDSDPRRVLVARGAWQSQWGELYRSKRCNGLRWRWETRARGASLAPIMDLPDLRLLGLKLRGVDDGLLADVSGVEELELWSDSTEPLDLSGTHGLRGLGVERTAPVALDGHETLESLWISGWRSDPVRVPSVFGLKSVRFEGAPGGPWIGEVHNLDAVPALRSLWFDGFLPATLEEVSARPTSSGST